MLLMFSSEPENFERYAQFHEHIYITASRLGAGKTMIRISISSLLRIEKT